MSTFFSKFSRRLSATRVALGSADRSLLLQITLFASMVPLLMRLSPRHLDRLLASRRSTGLAPTPEKIEAIVRHVRMARQIGSPLVGSGCLTRGLTLYYFLRRAGLDVNLCFGMGKVADRFTGHCWLMRAGEPFLEDRDPRLLYARMFSIPLDPSQPTPTARWRDLPCP